MRFRSAAAFGALAAIALAAQAKVAISAEDEPVVDCAKAQSTYEINVCSEKEFEKADKALNAAYKKALAQIASGGGEKPYDPKSWEEAMRASQRAWVAFRDADCKGLMAMEWQGGTGTTAAELSCMIQLTTARTKDLLDRYNNP
jgi:uncharacterized protein YecT (DUF1311 family)